MASIIGGPYMSGLAQYRGIGPGQVILAWGTRSNATEPPNPFKDDDIKKLVGDAIHAGTVPVRPTIFRGTNTCIRFFFRRA